MVSNFKMLTLYSAFRILSSAFEPTILQKNIFKIVSSKNYRSSSLLVVFFMMPPYNSLVAFVLLSPEFVIYILLLCQILLGSMCTLKEMMESMEARNS